MLDILKLILFSPIFFLELILFKFFGKKNSEKSYQAFVKIFALSGGKLNTIFTYFLSKKKANLTKLEEFKDLKFYNVHINEDLINAGYSLNANSVQINCIDNILNQLNKINGKYISDRYSSELDEYANINEPKAVKYKYNTDKLLKIPEIQNIIVDRRVVQIAQNYLGYHPIIDYVDCFWTFPSKFGPDKEAAQFWHFDLDRTKFLKLFVYLTNCELENGPHSYISGTHKPNSIPKNILKYGYSRIDTSLVDKNFEKERIITFTAKKGTTLFEDTIGLHKGSEVLSGSRLLLMIQFSTSLFGSKSKKISLDKKNFSEAFLNAQKNYLFLFKNFNL